MSRGLMVCGTGSDARKSSVVVGLCRLLARRGVRVAPFKAQNMSNNAFVTEAGHEIGRAQGVQALAAGIAPDVTMNPILLKPEGEHTSQVVVMGEPIGRLDAAQYQAEALGLLPTVLGAARQLREQVDVLIVEGAGSPAELNLLDRDIVNLRVASELALPAVIVGDIDRGGVLAALYGTVMLLPDHYRQLVRGFIINKFRGDRSLLEPGLDALEARCGVPTIGVLPWVDGLVLDAEDSLPLERRPWSDNSHGRDDQLDIAVIRFPRIANFTDFDPLLSEPGVRLRLVEDPDALGKPDLVVLPGTKATVEDLTWLRARGLHTAIREARASVLGICGGYQMLGRVIRDDVESARGVVAGLGWLGVETTFSDHKTVRTRHGRAFGHPLQGYEIHHGHIERGTDAEAWIDLDATDGTEHEGAVVDADPPIAGTSLHGIFEADHFRRTVLRNLATRAGKSIHFDPVPFAHRRERQFDHLADLLETYVDPVQLEHLLGV
jgi:adenosylcobyric acid synthase